MKRSILFLFPLFSIWLHSCDTGDFECNETEYLETTPKDTFFFGKWQWAFTRVYCWNNWPAVIGSYHLSDVIYPGDVRPWLPNGYPEREIELHEGFSITMDGEERSYCLLRWKSNDYTSGSSLYGPSPSLQLHLWYYDDVMYDVMTLIQYDALAKDTIEIFPDMKRDSTCGEKTYETVDYYVRVQ